MLLLLSLLACGFDDLRAKHTFVTPDRLWAPESVVAASDGLYVPLPAARRLAFVRPDGTSQLVELGAGVVGRVLTTPDPARVVAFVDRYRCLEDDPALVRSIESVSDCPSAELEVSTELVPITGGTAAPGVVLPSGYSGLAFSNDGAFAIAYLELEEGTALTGVLDLTAVLTIDFERSEATPIPVGFAADRVLFTEDGQRAVVLSQSAVAVVDLMAQPPRVEVTFPLTLDADQRVTPVGVALTPDGRYALISVQGNADLYVLDLEDHAVNMVSLSGTPAAMDVSPDVDRTVVVYSTRAVVDVLEHQLFDLESYPLDEPMNRVLRGPTFDLLYNDAGYHDVYRLYPDTGDVIEYRLQNPALSLHLSPKSDYAIALTRAEGGSGAGIEGYYDRNPGMEILDLRGDRDDTRPYLLEGTGVGVAWRSSDADLFALVLQQGIEYLYQLDLYRGDDLEIELSAPPLAIGTVPGGPFFITHDAGDGLISFLDPATGDVVEAAGFAHYDMFEPELLVEEEE